MDTWQDSLDVGSARRKFS